MDELFSFPAFLENPSTRKNARVFKKCARVFRKFKVTFLDFLSNAFIFKEKKERRFWEFSLLSKASFLIFFVFFSALTACVVEAASCIAQSNSTENQLAEDYKSDRLEIAVAITLDMPEETLKSLALEAKELGAKLLIRGIPLREKERKTLLSRGHFKETKAIQEENRALIRAGFKRLLPFAKVGVPLEINPKLFTEENIKAAPVVLFNYGERVIRIRGVASILLAAALAAREIEKAEDGAFYTALTRLEERRLDTSIGRTP